MRLLFEADKKDHALCTHSYRRDSARSIIIIDGKVAMIHSLKFGYYKFPGGGIEKEESPAEAMIRETREEAGLVVLPDTVKEYGYVHRVQRSTRDKTVRFIQDNYYYLCDVERDTVSQKLDNYEAEEGFTLEFVSPETAITKNRLLLKSFDNTLMLEREARVLELLIKEGFIGR